MSQRFSAILRNFRKEEGGKRGYSNDDEDDYRNNKDSSSKKRGRSRSRSYSRSGSLSPLPSKGGEKKHRSDRGRIASRSPRRGASPGETTPRKAIKKVAEIARTLDLDRRLLHATAEAARHLEM